MATTKKYKYEYYDFSLDVRCLEHFDPSGTETIYEYIDKHLKENVKVRVEVEDE